MCECARARVWCLLRLGVSRLLLRLLRVKLGHRKEPLGKARESQEK